MSGQGLDYDTRRRIREFIRRHPDWLTTAQQVRVHFRLPADIEPDIRDLMTETALLGRLASPALEVRTPPAEVLDILLTAVAAASTRVHVNLMTCRMCRNRLLYLLDTAPYAGDSLHVITSRLQALDDNHRLFHQNPDAADHGDSKPPLIRWITS